MSKLKFNYEFFILVPTYCFEVRRKSVHPVYGGLLCPQGYKVGGKSVYYVYPFNSFQAVGNSKLTWKGDSVETKK
jgi:hypothetical protein